MTAVPASGTSSPSGPPSGLQDNQNSTAAAAQQVPRLDPSVRASRTGAPAGSLAVSTARAMPAPNQPR